MTSKQVYTVKNSNGKVIGARQSDRAYTHALIINDTQVEAYSSSEQGARRAISKFFRYKTAEFKAQHTTAVVPVECIGAGKFVMLTFEGYTHKMHTFHAYKYAVINTATGKVAHFAKPEEGLCYTLEQAQEYAARYVRTPVEIVSVIDPRNAVEPAPAPVVEPAPAPVVEPAPAPVSELSKRTYVVEDGGQVIGVRESSKREYTVAVIRRSDLTPIAEVLSYHIDEARALAYRGGASEFARCSLIITPVREIFTKAERNAAKRAAKAAKAKSYSDRVNAQQPAPAVEPAPAAAPAVESAPAPAPAPAVESAPAPAPAPAVDKRAEYHLIDERGAVVASYVNRLDAVDAVSRHPEHTLEYDPCYAGDLTGKHNGAYCDHHPCTCVKCKQAPAPAPAPAPAVESAPTQESDIMTHITLKRLSAPQLAVFNRAPLCRVEGRWVLFNESDAPALINALESLTGVDQRTQMKCARRVLQATGGTVEVKRRQAAPVCLPCHIRIRTGEQARGVLTFIDKHLVSGAVSAVTRTHTLVNKASALDLLEVLRDMHMMKINTRSCHALIKALEQAPAPVTQLPERWQLRRPDAHCLKQGRCLSQASDRG